MLAAGGAAHADPVYDRCVNAASDNASWSLCGSALIKREDDRLNAVWQRVFGSTSGQTRIDLRAEQRSWIVFKEASCRFYANGDFGREGTVLSFPVCRAGVIADRTRALEAIGQSLKRP